MIGPSFTVSLDFELFWGVKDKRTIAAYGRNILGVREALPAMLQAFSEFGVHVTWATVGLLLFRDKAELLAHLPSLRPAYHDRRLDLYAGLDALGADEGSDPYHYGYSLVRRIMDTPGMEIGSHTFGHFNCLEAGAGPEAFRADLQAAQAAFGRLGLKPVSLVFPRNQYDAASLAVAAECGIEVFRGNPRHAFYAPEAQSRESRWKRLGRLVDAYVDLTGPLAATPRPAGAGAPLDAPASRFLRPFSRRLAPVEGLRLRRICGAMSAAAQRGENFHLWWHPHNFGADPAGNLAILRRILRHHADLRERHGMQSLTMGELAQRVRGHVH